MVNYQLFIDPAWDNAGHNHQWPQLLPKGQDKMKTAFDRKCVVTVIVIAASITGLSSDVCAQSPGGKSYRVAVFPANPIGFPFFDCFSYGANNQFTAGHFGDGNWSQIITIPLLLSLSAATATDSEGVSVLIFTITIGFQGNVLQGFALNSNLSIFLLDGIEDPNCAPSSSPNVNSHDP